VLRLIRECSVGPHHDEAGSPTSRGPSGHVRGRHRRVQAVNRVHERRARSLKDAELAVERPYRVGRALLSASAQQAGTEDDCPDRHEDQKDHDRQVLLDLPSDLEDPIEEPCVTGGWSGTVRAPAALGCPTYYSTPKPMASALANAPLACGNVRLDGLSRARLRTADAGRSFQLVSSSPRPTSCRPRSTTKARAGIRPPRR
jgi:hypothetical protein